MCSGCRKCALYLWIQSIWLCDSLRAQKWRTLVPLLLRVHPSPIKTSSISWTALWCTSEMGDATQASISSGVSGEALPHLFFTPFFLGWVGVQGQTLAPAQRLSTIRKAISEQPNASHKLFPMPLMDKTSPKERGIYSWNLKYISSMTKAT